MSALRNDLRLALRSIRGAPGFTMVAVLTLGLGIGANSAIFSFVDGVLLRPLPYPNGERLLEVFEKPPRGNRGSVSTLNFLDWKRHNAVFSEMAAQTGAAVTLTGGSEPVQLQGGRVTWPFLDLFGLKPALGRTFSPEEDQPGKDQVVILSHRIWESRFGSDRAVLGRVLLLDGKPYTVVGILPPGGPFDKGFQDVWMPLAFSASDRTRNVRWLRVWARLKPGVSLERAQAEMSSLAAQIERESPESNNGWGVTLVRLVDDITTRTLRQSLFILLAAVGAVLLIACANLANLQIARASARGRELAIRAAVGAGRWRLIRQFLVESLLLALLGGLLGVLIAYGFIAALKAWIPPDLLPPEAVVRLDIRVLLFTASTVVATGLLFGIIPALNAVRGDLALSLKEGGVRTTSSAGNRRVRDLLVVIEVAMAFILLSGAGLLIRTFYDLLRVNPGFETSRVLTMSLPMAADQYPDEDHIVSYLSRVQDKIAAVPGVRGVGATSVLPFLGWGWEMPFHVEGMPPVGRANRPTCFFKVVSPSYFGTLGMHLREGRSLSDTDTARAPFVAVINQSMAERYFPGEPPVGKRILLPRILSGKHRGPDTWWQVAGVVGDEKVRGLNDSSAGVYVSYRQSPALGVSLVIRAASDPNQLVRDVQAAVRELNPSQPVADVRPLEEIKEATLGSNRLRTGLLSLFAGLALLLAAIGIYGVLSYSVAQRGQEMGVRAALGATRWDQLRLVVGGGIALAGFGILLGVAGSLALNRVLASLLFGVSPHDPLTLLLVGVVLLVVSSAACVVPARRAMRIDPVTALRHE